MCRNEVSAGSRDSQTVPYASNNIRHIKIIIQASQIASMSMDCISCIFAVTVVVFIGCRLCHIPNAGFLPLLSEVKTEAYLALDSTVFYKYYNFKYIKNTETLT